MATAMADTADMVVMDMEATADTVDMDMVDTAAITTITT